MTKNISSIPRDFNPTIASPAYLTRKCLLKKIEQYSSYFTGSIMDFGCGSKPYKSLFDVTEYIGVDFQGEGHSHENEVIDVFYDGKSLPFENERFDAIFSSEVFEHIFNLEQILSELHRVLKPGGRILITCPFAICEHEMPNDFARYTSYGLKDLLERNDFTVIKFEKAGTSFETISQLFISYFYFDILRRFLGKVPGLRTGARIILISLLNLFSVGVNYVLPKGNSLYLNNIALAVRN